jgi:hypothetical protein
MRFYCPLEFLSCRHVIRDAYHGSQLQSESEHPAAFSASWLASVASRTVTAGKSIALTQQPIGAAKFGDHR